MSPLPEEKGWILDASLVPAGVALLALYNISFYYRVKATPLTTVVGVNHINRRAWVKAIMKDIDKKNILAVQTLRNSIMASTLLASTAMVIAAATAAFVSSSTSSVTVQTSINSILIGSTSPVLTSLKFLAILLCFLFSFMCHVQSIRYTNHVNFLISIPQCPELPGLTPDYVSSILARGSDFYTVGTRGFYCAFPFLLWLFGPIPMFVCCVLMVPALFRLDTATGFDTDLRSSHHQGICETHTDLQNANCSTRDESRLSSGDIETGVIMASAAKTSCFSGGGIHPSASSNSMTGKERLDMD